MGGVFRDLRKFFALQRAEEYLHTARAQGRGNVGGAARGGADEAKIGGQAVLKDVVDISGRGLVPGVVIGAVEAHHAVFEYLEQLVHLHGVHLADLVEKKHAAVGARDRAFLGLRHSALPKRTGALIDGIMNTAEERVGDGALVKAQAGGVHLDKGRICGEGGTLRALGRFQRQPRRAGLAHARRAVDEDVLRVLAAQHSPQRAHAVLRSDDLGKAPRAHGLVERLGKADGAKMAHVFHLGAPLAAGRTRLAVAAELAEKIEAHHQGEHKLHRGEKKRHICPPAFVARP